VSRAGGEGTAAGGRWALRLDGTRCDAHGLCVLRCPELVTLDERGFAGVEPGAISGKRLLRKARRAAAGCPERALAVVAVGEAVELRSSPTVPGQGSLQGARSNIGGEVLARRTGGRA